MRLLVFLLLASITLVGCNASSDTAGKKVGEVEDLEIIVSENRLKSTKVKVSSSKPIATFPNQVELGIQSIL